MSKRSSEDGPRWTIRTLWGAASLAAACSASTATPSKSDYTDQQVEGEGLPCDVAALLASKCTGCHADPPVGEAPMPLLTFADLTAPASSDPSKTVAEVSLERMRSITGVMPPPPGAPATAAEIAAFEAWLGAGMPEGTCHDPFDDPAQCTSGRYWTQGDEGSKNMNPGKPCVSCHAKDAEEAPKLAVGGTVYATAHEPDRCEAEAVTGPAISTAIVEITDKNGQIVTLAVSSVGNFHRRASAGPIALPYTARVLYDGRERAMMAAQTSGDCNACHTQYGKDGPRGRILLP